MYGKGSIEWINTLDTLALLPVRKHTSLLQLQSGGTNSLANTHGYSRYKHCRREFKQDSKCDVLDQSSTDASIKLAGKPP